MAPFTAVLALTAAASLGLVNAGELQVGEVTAGVLTLQMYRTVLAIVFPWWYKCGGCHRSTGGQSDISRPMA